ncbi:hypothetical protein O7632_16310 [Solwaraspora sp. WMMD406]|uniref:hypothetical protein n=1 Tax=Solwaraspora sp. WMMD406 TaxID=3016095 RepID=UPI002416070E|nr:hypothetical protein [Solwaraspora sp. WMMD406]MDG4765650.1 hypothetical protein [Solwaraspora sp. WMMD406]
MLRNDGIGGTPRLARYTSFGGRSRSSEPTPNRPPLPRRTPGTTDINQDRRFRLAAARGVTPAPPEARTGGPHSPSTARTIAQARDDATLHLPSRIGECRRCDVAAPCRPFLRALAILDRWDGVTARRIRAVLHLSGLSSPEPLMEYGLGDDAEDETDGDPDAV